jgi:VWA domain-containing protein
LDHQQDILSADDAQSPARERSSRRRLIERATIMGLMISVAVHLVILLLAALITIDFGFGDAGGGDAGEVDFAVIVSSDLAQTSSPKLEFESFEVAITPNESVVEIDLLSDSSTDQSVNELADSIAPSLDPGGGSLTSIDANTGSAGAGTGDGASFFGLEAQGRRFAYIVDVSGSMNSLTGDGEMTRWELTRAELLRSISGLDKNIEFFIVLYSSTPISLFGNTKWVQADMKSKRLVGTGLFGITPAGGTKPIAAFSRVFSLDPEPDAIYFMTDGLVETDVPAQIRQMNRRKLIPIHCILFGELGNTNDSQAAKNMLTNIAKNSGGKFTHIKEGRP